MWSNSCFLVVCYKGPQNSPGTFHVIRLLLELFSHLCFSASSFAHASTRGISKVLEQGFSCLKTGFIGEYPSLLTIFCIFVAFYLSSSLFSFLNTHVSCSVTTLPDSTYDFPMPFSLSREKNLFWNMWVLGKIHIQ